MNAIIRGLVAAIALGLGHGAPVQDAFDTVLAADKRASIVQGAVAADNNSGIQCPRVSMSDASILTHEGEKEAEAIIKAMPQADINAFHETDTNNDGVLDLDEMTPEDATAEDQESAKMTLDIFDVDKDAKLSFEEFQSMHSNEMESNKVLRSDEHPDEGEDGVKLQGTPTPEQDEKDDEGHKSQMLLMARRKVIRKAEEAAGAAITQSSPTVNNEALLRMFKATDTNHDNVIDVHEYAAAGHDERFDAVQGGFKEAIAASGTSKRASKNAATFEFDVLDSDGNGVVPLSELTKALEAKGWLLPTAWHTALHLAGVPERLPHVVAALLETRWDDKNPDEAVCAAASKNADETKALDDRVAMQQLLLAAQHKDAPPTVHETKRRKMPEMTKVCAPLPMPCLQEPSLTNRFLFGTHAHRSNKRNSWLSRLRPRTRRSPTSCPWSFAGGSRTTEAPARLQAALPATSLGVPCATPSAEETHIAPTWTSSTARLTAPQGRQTSGFTAAPTAIPTGGNPAATGTASIGAGGGARVSGAAGRPRVAGAAVAALLIRAAPASHRGQRRAVRTVRGRQSLTTGPRGALSLPTPTRSRRHWVNSATPSRKQATSAS